MTKKIMRRRCASRRSLLLHSRFSLAIAACCFPLSSAQHVYTDSFPTNDEYDFNILDAYNVYGSPYGGFGRATPSRLAALPLVLPGVAGDEERYFEVRDAKGRLYSCRVYHEDELDPSSLTDSMFDTAKLRKEEENGAGEALSAGEAETTSAGDAETANENPPPKEETSTNAETSEVFNKFHAVAEIDHLLSKLDGVCSQIHMGWWSYEWCYDQRVTQFHIHVEKGASKNPQEKIRLESVTSLGKFTTRKIDQGDPLAGIDDPLSDSDKEKLKASQPKALGVVTDYFESGDTCPDTQMPRHTSVEYRCCSLDMMKRYKSAVVYKGLPVPSNIAAITSMKEDPTKVCTYYMEVCTPLLCEGLADAFQNGLVAEEVINKPATQPVVALRNQMRPKLKEGASIREILAATITNTCLRFYNGGWWVYEVCHGRHVRQFHEEDRINPATGAYARIPESVHMLGHYAQEELEGFPNEQEPIYVTNPVGDQAPQVALGKKKSGKEGNGAYFVQEYTGGDVCDHTDVTDAAIKAGNVGEGGIERATTVRYFCGHQLEMVRVNEDSTCHYVMDITIPELCQHALFKAPVIKKEVVKCLPVDSNEMLT